jgi:hypothetical protein
MISSSTRVALRQGEAFLMSIHKRGVRRLDLVDGDAVPAVLVLRMLIDDGRDLKGQERADLQVWESEGGNPSTPTSRRSHVELPTGRRRPAREPGRGS